MGYFLNWDKEGERLYETGIDRGVIVMDAWVFINGKNPLDLTLYTSAVNTLYCVIDENSTTITSTTQNLGTLDLGLHHIVVKSGDSSNINFYGFKFVKSVD